MKKTLTLKYPPAFAHFPPLRLYRLVRILCDLEEGGLTYE